MRSMAIILFLLLILPSTLFAQGAGKMVAIQAKKYTLKHEFNFGIGGLPLSAYYKGLSYGVGYTYHFSDFYGWRILNFQYVTNIATGLKDSLENNFGVTPSAFAKIHYYIHTDFVLTPVYRKMILFNRWVVHGETIFLAGVGAFKFRGQPATAGAAPQNGKFRPALDLGIGFRVWLNQWLSARMDAIWYLYFATASNINNEIYLGLNFAINFPLKPKEDN